MNSLELRYAIYKSLMSQLQPATNITAVGLSSPEPGEPVAIVVGTLDPSGDTRTYVLTIVEI